MISKIPWMAALALMAAVEARAQDQTVTFTSTSAGISGGARNGCVNADWYVQDGRQITFTWTDTTGAATGKVRVEAFMRWSYYSQSSLDVDVEINGVDQPEPLESPTSQPQSCGQSEVTGSTHETGITTWNPLAQNSLTLTVPQGGTAVFNITGAFMFEIRVTKLNDPPAPPASLAQRGQDAKGIAVGGVTAFKTVEIRAAVTDPDGDQVHLEAEIRPVTVFFTGEPTVAGAPVASGQTAGVTWTGIPDGPYHWQVRTVDENGERSPWVSFGDNSEVLADFRIDSSVQAPPVDLVDDHGGGDCGISVGRARPFLIPMFIGFAVAAAFLARRRRTITV